MYKVYCDKNREMAQGALEVIKHLVFITQNQLKVTHNLLRIALIAWTKAQWLVLLHMRLEGVLTLSFSVKFPESILKQS